VAAKDFAETILDTLQARTETGPAEVRAAFRGVLREVAPDRLLPPQAPAGSVFQYDGANPGEKKLLIRTPRGYRHIGGNDAGANPVLDWRYVSKLPGLVQLVPDMAGQAPPLPWAPTSDPTEIVRTEGDMLWIGNAVLDANDVRALVAIGQRFLEPSDAAKPSADATA
jgi:hypothetical protein